MRSNEERVVEVKRRIAEKERQKKLRRSRIAAVYSNDGPGFLPDFLARPAMQELSGRITTIIPRDSVVGMLMTPASEPIRVKSSARGLLQHDGLTELIVTRDMAERKTKMIELGDAFIAFPGGTGTLEEIAEVMSRVSLGQLDAPCILYDLNGYYDSLKALLAKMIEKGLSTPQRQQGIRFAANLEEITTILNKA